MDEMKKLENITTFDFKELNRFDKIFVLVSGGVDSTYLFEVIKQECKIEKVWAVNCYNPFETNECLKEIAKYERYIQIKPEESIDYKDILKSSFRLIPKAIEAKKNKKYTKSIFPCCKLIKHNAFKKHPMFKAPNTVVISGIKPTDGQQRRLWLHYLRTGKKTTKEAKPINAPTFYYRHADGQLYCYPYRDYNIDKKIETLKGSDFPKHVMDILKEKYPNLRHSGCMFCPVLVVFADKIRKSKKTDEHDLKRLENSIKFYEKVSMN